MSGDVPMFRSNREIAIHAPDLDRAEGFYVGILGFQLLSRSTDQLVIDTGELRLYVNRDAFTSISYIPSFDVPDHEAARQELLAAGCKTFKSGAHPDAVYFVDPFGFVFDIIERRSG